MIVNLTHNEDGSARVRRSITTKVAIGLPPNERSNYPTRLDHFVFQRKTSKGVMTVVKQPGGGTKNVMQQKVVWDVDAEMMKFYGETCREFWIVLMDDDPDQVFRTEMAIWTKTQCVCRGDGEMAFRKTKERPEGQDHQPCANHGCPELEQGLCNPSGDFYFILADFPAIGTICKMHTSSYQSIREISAALNDLRSITGGRLQGVRAKLTMRLENSSYRDKAGVLHAGTKWILGLELTAKDIQQLTDGLASGLAFDTVRRRLGSSAGPVIEIEDDPEDEIAGALAPEFYPADAISPAPAAVAPTNGFHPPAGNTPAANTPPAPPAPTVAQAAPSQPTTDEITDDDLPDSFFEVQEAADPTPIGAGPQAARFGRALAMRKRQGDVVAKYLQEVHGVASSFAIRTDRFEEAMRWALNPLPDEPAPEQSPDEIHCRAGFGALGLDLVEQAELIAQAHDGQAPDVVDWGKVRGEINRLADKEAQG